jgi:hypothetical protein
MGGQPAGAVSWTAFRHEITVLCVRWYLRFPLSYCNSKEMMPERGLSRRTVALVDLLPSMVHTSGDNVRPASVTWSARILVASLVIAVLQVSVPGLAAPLRSGTSAAEAVLVRIASATTILLLTRLILRGKNGARVTFAVLFVPGLVPWLLVDEFSASVLAGLTSLVIATLQMFALVLLFRRESNEWFKLKPATAKAVQRA